MKNYLNFDLLFERSGEQYRACVLSSPSGQATSDFSVPFSDQEVEDFLSKIGRTRREGLSIESSKEIVKIFGTRLFEAIFAGDALICLRKSLENAQRDESGLRFRLRFENTPELADLPWEYLCDPSRGRPFSLSRETPIVRYCQFPEPGRSMMVKRPLRVLVMISNPTDYTPIDVEQEWTKLKEAFEDLERRELVVLERLEKATLPALQKQFREGKYHIFHFIGHGGSDVRTKAYVPIMEDDRKLGRLVDGSDLATVLCDEPTLRLTLLNVCRENGISHRNSFTNTAFTLVKQGIPAVIFKHFEATDESTTIFAHALYDALAQGNSVDIALAEARKRIRAEGYEMEWGTPVLYMRVSDGYIFDLKQERARLFISYKRNVEPDESLALRLYDELKQQHHVFIDQVTLVGKPWAQHIEAELHQTDFLIALLSAESIHSEMVREEIRTAHYLAKDKKGHPTILPVRLAYSKSFPYPLGAYLNDISWISWQDHEDTPGLIKKLKQAISAGVLTSVDIPPKPSILQESRLQPVPPPLPSAQPFRLEMPEGTIDPQSVYYVERDVDHIALEAIARQGVTITIKAPRQMGKSSLLIRTMTEARKQGKRVAFLDFQLFDKATLNNATDFYRQFCAALSDRLEMPNRLDDFWKAELGNNQSCSRYVSRYLLAELKSPLVLAMDEVESIFDTEFRSDFFGMLRNWHNSRAIDPIWKQLDLALVTSTEPYQLIQNLNQSPFNVGEVIDLADFTLEQVADLNQRHGSPLTSSDEQHLMTILSGHPYLVRRALYLVASKRLSATELFSQASDERGPFGDHLRYHLFRFHGKKDLIEGMQQVISKNTCTDDLVFFRLRGAGLVKREGRAVVPRCQLYAIYFREHLHG